MVKYISNDSQNLNELIELAKTNYDSGDIIDFNYLKWQYKDNPIGKPVSVVAKSESNDELVGQYIVIPINYKLKNEIITGTLSLNTLTREDFRGKGLFTKMALATYQECAEKEYNFTVGFPNQKSYSGFIKRLNFIHLTDVPLLIKPIKPIKIFLNKIQKKSEKHGGEIELKIQSKLIKNIQFNELNVIDDKKEYNTFWDQYSNIEKILINKDFTFLNWRYTLIPSRKYHVIKATVNDKILSIAVIRAQKTLGSKTGIIMDFMCLPNYEDVGNEMVSYIESQLRTNKIELLACLISKNSMEYSLLKKNKFIKVPKFILPQPIPMILRINNEFKDSDFIKKEENWQISFGDYDVF